MRARIKAYAYLTFIGVFLSLSWVSPKLALAGSPCTPATNPDADTYCDLSLHPENFDGNGDGQICVSEPAPPSGGTDPEMVGSSICISGFVDGADRLATLFLEVNSLDNPAPVPPPPGSGSQFTGHR